MKLSMKLSPLARAARIASQLTVGKRPLLCTSKSFHVAGSPLQTFDKDNLLLKMTNLRSTYSTHYAFPRCVVETYVAKHFADYERDASQCAIFYDKGASPGDVLALATQREPVNIGMSRAYDQSKMEKFFGWRTGMYGELAEKTKDVLPPNIAIMCPTPVVQQIEDIGVQPQ